MEATLDKASSIGLANIIKSDKATRGGTLTEIRFTGGNFLCFRVKCCGDSGDSVTRLQRKKKSSRCHYPCDCRANINGVHWDGALCSVPIGNVDINFALRHYDVYVPLSTATFWYPTRMGW
jgi:hypothetical protein